MWCLQTLADKHFWNTRDSNHLRKDFHFLPLSSLSLKAPTMEETSEGETRIGGHDFLFVDELSPGQTCSICLVAMRNPVQTACGDRFCESCLLETLRYYWHAVLFLLSSYPAYSSQSDANTDANRINSYLIYDLHFSGNAMMIRFVHKIGIPFLTEGWVDWNKQTYMMKLPILWAVACNWITSKFGVTHEKIRILYLYTFCA